MCYKPDSSSDWSLRKSQTSAQIQPLHPTFCSLLCLPIVTFSGALPWSCWSLIWVDWKERMLTAEEKHRMYSFFKNHFCLVSWSCTHGGGLKLQCGTPLWETQGREQIAVFTVGNLAGLQIQACTRQPKKQSMTALEWAEICFVPSNNWLLIRTQFKFPSSGFSSLFPFGREVTLTTVT